MPDIDAPIPYETLVDGFSNLWGRTDLIDDYPEPEPIEDDEDDDLPW